MTSQYLLTNGSGDNKWQTTKDGYYHIHVDVFRETIKAEFLGSSVNQTTGIEEEGMNAMESTPAYNLAGQRVAEGNRGIIIRNGKNYIKGKRL